MRNALTRGAGDTRRAFLKGNFSPSWGRIFLGVIVLAGVGGLQILVKDSILNNTEKLQTVCEFTDWVVGDKNIGMNLSCEDGEKGFISENEVIVSYLNDPGSLACKRYETGRVLCEMRDTKEEGHKTP